MQQLLQILVAGGDRRQQYAAQKLAKSPQLSVTTIGFSQSDSETLPEFDVLILPIHTTAESVPSKNGNLSLPELLSHVKKGGLVCGGVLPEELCFCDYFQREELCLANAVPTVEGAIQIAISERETVLCGSSVLVIGYGRIGTIMAERLQGLKADVTVAARSCKDAERCAANGLKWMHPSEIAARAGKFDWFCNTVPVLMLDETALSNMTWHRNRAERILMLQNACIVMSSGRWGCRESLHRKPLEQSLRKPSSIFYRRGDSQMKETIGKRIGFAVTGSFCTFSAAFAEAERLVAAGYSLTPIFSEHAASIDTRFGKAVEQRKKLEQICGKPALLTISDVEPLGPKDRLDALLVAPCTANTMAKLAMGITDTTVTMAVKSMLRNEKPIILALATNDALRASAKNLGLLLNTKNYYFVPLRQDAPVKKPSSLVADFTQIPDTVAAALGGLQIQPMFIQNL